MTGNHGDGGAPPKKVPDGVLADEVLSKEKAAEVSGDQKLLATPAPTTLPVDPNYTEPESYDSLLKMCNDIDTAWAADGDNEKCRLQRGLVLNLLLARVKVLEQALLPFANSAMIMSNARMCLIADNRPDEPAGGTWYSNVQGIQLMPNEGLYFNACDVYGRRRVHDNIVATFEKLQKAQSDQREKDKHVEDGGAVH